MGVRASEEIRDTLLGASWSCSPTLRRQWIPVRWSLDYMYWMPGCPRWSQGWPQGVPERHVTSGCLPRWQPVHRTSVQYSCSIRLSTHFKPLQHVALDHHHALINKQKGDIGLSFENLRPRVRLGMVAVGSCQLLIMFRFMLHTYIVSRPFRPLF